MKESVKLLQDPSPGDKIWALSTLSVSNLRAMPDHASELVSQTLMGTPLKVLDFKDKWYRVQTPEQYTGFMDISGLQLLTTKEIDHWRKSDRYFFNRFSGFAYDAPSDKGMVVTDMVSGDLFEVDSTFNEFFEIKIPDGRLGYIPKTDCISFKDRSSQEPNIQSLLSAAGQMMGSAYLWGGTSVKGADCSGFVKQIYYSQGIILARDASQQAKYGEPIDFSNTDNLRQGDLLFFGSSAEHVSHVGIYIGKGYFIHSSGRVHISSIDPANPQYDNNRNHVGACRIMSSLNTDGIVRIKDHPWYNFKP